MTDPITYADTDQLNALIIAGYDRLVEFQLREQPTFRQLVDRRPVNVTNPGETVYFTWYQDMAVSKEPLSETVDPAPAVVDNPSRTSVTLEEFGTWLPKSIRLQKLAFTQPDTEIAELLARQQGDTIDALVRDVMDSSTNVIGSGTTAFTSALVRQMRNHMRRENVPFADGSSYVAYLHPDVSFDLMSEAGQNVWASPAVYQDTTKLYTAEVGKYSAVRFVENTRCKVVDATSSADAVYSTYLLGRQGLVEAVAIEPHTVLGPQTDSLRRIAKVGWHAMIGWNIFRPEGLAVVKSKSSLAPKTA